MRSYLSLVSVVALAACAGIPDENDARTNAGDDSGLEEIYSATVGERGVNIRAASNGCTDEDSFDVNIEQGPAVGGAPSHVLSLVRTSADLCPGFKRDGALLSFSREELGVPEEETITVANPLGPPRREP